LHSSKEPAKRQAAKECGFNVTGRRAGQCAVLYAGQTESKGRLAKVQFGGKTLKRNFPCNMHRAKETFKLQTAWNFKVAQQ
jgi:hypothetical protein